MKIIKNDVAYVQKNDIARLMHSCSMIPASLFDGLFSKGCFIVTDENRYDFLEFRDEDDIDFFRCVDWIVDYDELKKMSDDQIVELGNEIVHEQNKIAESYNFMTEFERKKNQNLIQKYDCLEHKLNSLTCFVLFRRGDISMKLPEEICENNVLSDKVEEKKGVKKLFKSIFNKRRNV